MNFQTENGIKPSLALRLANRAVLHFIASSIRTYFITITLISLIPLWFCTIPLAVWNIPLYDCNVLSTDWKHPLCQWNFPSTDWNIPLYGSKPCQNWALLLLHTLSVDGCFMQLLYFARIYQSNLYIDMEQEHRRWAIKNSFFGKIHLGTIQDCKT